MRSSFFTSLSITLVSVLAVNAAPNEPRQVTTHHGSLVQPASGAVIAPGASFAYQYGDSNWCETGYSPISVYLTDHAPVPADLNSTGQYPDGTFLFFFGQYLQNNFGLPVMSPAPPTSLTFPTLPNTPSGTQLFVSVVEQAHDCPPGGQPPQWGVTGNPIIVG